MEQNCITLSAEELDAVAGGISFPDWLYHPPSPSPAPGWPPIIHSAV